MSAQDTVSGFGMMIATATSRETGILWRSSSITARLPECCCRKRSGRPALNSKVQSSGDGYWIQEPSPGRKASRRSLTWNPPETGGSGWPRDNPFSDIYRASPPLLPLPPPLRPGMATLRDGLAAEETGIREISDRPSREILSSGPVRLTTIERSCFTAMSESITRGRERGCSREPICASSPYEPFRSS